MHQLRHIAWLTIVYTVSVATMQPLYSRLSDIYGRKALLLLSYLFFAVGILLCAVTYNFWFLVVSRMVVGAGSAGLGYMVALIFNDIIPLQDRATWQGILQIFSFLGQLIGGMLGGLLVDRVGWRWTFTLELPVAVAGAIAVMMTVRLPPLPTQKIKLDPAGKEVLRPAQKASFDVLGAAVLSSFIATLVFALSMGGNDVPWNHPVIPALLSFSLVFFASFVFVEMRSSSTPLIPLRLMIRKSTWPIFAVTFFKDMAGIPQLYLFSLYSNISSRHSTVVGGLLITLVAIGSAFGTLVSGISIRRLGRLKKLLVGSMVLLLATTLTIRFRWKGSESVGEAGFEMILCGICDGIAIGTLLVGLLKSVELNDKAAIYGAYHLCIAVSGLVGLSITTAILQSRSRVYMAEALHGQNPDNITKIIDSCIESLQCLETLPDDIQKAVSMSYTRSIGDGFTFVCVSILISLAFSLFAEEYHISPEE